MKVLLQRHGIVIKSVDVRSDRASIGSSPDADIMIDDPYLAAQVADIVRQADGWHLIDSGTSLEGVTRNGQRVEDELVAFGQAYSIGGFELVVRHDGEEAARNVAADTPRQEQLVPGTVAENRPVALPTVGENIAVPHTMMETELPAAAREVPRTMFEAPNPVAPVRPAPAAQTHARVASAAPRPAAAIDPKKRRARILLLATALGLGFLLLLIVIVGGGEKKKPNAAPVATQTTPAPKAPPSSAVSSSSAAAQNLAALRFDDALQAWENQIASGTADAKTRQRYTELAFEVGRIHAANGSAAAQQYFADVVKYGTPDSAAVAEAKRRLDR